MGNTRAVWRRGLTTKKVGETRIVLMLTPEFV